MEPAAPPPRDPVAEGLFNFAIDREDVTWLAARLPTDLGEVTRNTVEYELQIVKIVFVGWAILYTLEESAFRQEIAEQYWQALHELAASVSHTTGLMIGGEVDYFAALRERLDQYLDTLQRDSGADPAGAVGQAFAAHCGLPGDLVVAMAGSRLFAATVGRVKEFLHQVATAAPPAKPH